MNRKSVLKNGDSRTKRITGNAMQSKVCCSYSKSTFNKKSEGANEQNFLR